jgi:hypothetical protein
MEFNDSHVYDCPDNVITKAAYILFFRRMSSSHRTLEDLRAEDQRCQDGSEWMEELLRHQVECRGAMADDQGSFRDEFEDLSNAASALQSMDLGRASSSSDSEKGQYDDDYLHYHSL